MITSRQLKQPQVKLVLEQFFLHKFTDGSPMASNLVNKILKSLKVPEYSIQGTTKLTNAVKLVRS